jgi:hypothetical protein
MSHDVTEEIFVAAQAGGCASVIQLRRLIHRFASEYRKTRSPDAAFFAGRAYYEMSVHFPGRAQKVRTWLQRTIVGRSEDVFSYFLLGCLSFDEGEYLSAFLTFEKIPPGAFGVLNPYWTWRDIKVLELRCASAIQMNDLDRMASVANIYVEAISVADETDIPAPHELVSALSVRDQLNRYPAIVRLLERHVQINWGDELGSEITRLSNLKQQRG